ncbi:MAG: transcription-repair coupling factor [Coriobacteriales bacterium]|nr:transcription-repair coupling factor [Coriobacteriales bacterium]
MLIHRVANQLLCAPELREPLRNLREGKDASVGVAQSARPLLVAALWASDPRPCLVVVPGEEGAERVLAALAAWLGQDVVARYKDRSDWPWSNKPADDAVVGSRCAAMERLSVGEPCVVVTSARALLRRVPPVGSGYYCSSTFCVGDEVEFEDVPRLLVGMGYADTGEVDVPGTFHVHGDAVDVFPAQAKTPVRMEFFGDEIDRIRRMVAATKQTIGDEESVRIVPCRELALTNETVARARRSLHRAAMEDTSVAADLELIEQRANAPQLDRYLAELYGGKTASPVEHMSKRTLVVLLEPRTLLDDCSRALDDIKHAAGVAHVPFEQLYTPLKAFDFGKEQQRVSLSSIMRAGATRPTTARGRRAGASAPQAGDLYVQQPGISGRDSRMLGRLRQLLRDGSSVLFAVPDRGARKHLEMRFVDESIPFEESLGTDPQNAAGALDAGALDSPAFTRGVVTFVDASIPSGVVVPSARLAVLSIADLSSHTAKKRRQRRIDPTTTTFPFKPGDYVVHARHGIALFTGIVRQEMGGKERDYFLLQYANEDKLYVPLERVDRITRYVGPDGSAPRLTRLNTADWSRATGKARKSAKKLAFDLVDLYTRRSAAKGHAFSPDTPAQLDMESSFSYDMTPDQASAVEDIKADMETPKPMDRLLCGDVGFGKTEVALRAAFKCCMDGRQVMILCPTTILAQQHYDTFFDRFAPFDLRVEVLSRFVTPARQRRALADFAKGDVHVLVGTHRLLSADVNPYALGLVIVDEEQRFGVQHKEQLKNLREQVDVLTLSATPIPRTMQMALSGVRDMSLILTPPPGRRPVKVHVGEYDPDVVSDAIRFELARGGQVYYVSNRVHTIDEAVDRVLQAVPEARVAVAHGQMSPNQVEEVMLSFQMQEVDVLVATTIIESGIDNPHTNTLVIEDSQRLGLAQLYQLKGRVGRGREQAYAYFMFPAELPLTPEATERLTALSELQDLGSGMRIAMRDLEIRGAGSLVGAEQHGNLSSVGFDLFTQMLGQAVAEARGEVPEGDEPSEVVINLSADFYLAEEYLPDVDKRVMAYRRLAAANELADVDRLQKEIEDEFGGMPLAARNIFDRTRVRIRCERLGIGSVALTGGRLVFLGVELPADVARDIRAQRALYFPKTHQLKVPFKADAEEMLPTTLRILERIGGADE